tara:strand:+ start:363 stop:653 length:291 start_codon:yes stop_codon:yes gene_type:complete
MGNSFSRQVKRNKLKKAKKALKKDIATKMSLFGHLGDECMVCSKPFDKKDKKQVMSWSVVVKEKENQVNLYCPECWNNARAIIDDFKKRVEERNDR